MSERILFNVYVTVHEGKVEEFKRVAKELIAVNEKRPEILCYEWFPLDEDEREFQIVEIFESSEAMLSENEPSVDADYHRIHGELEKLYVMTKMEVLGNASDALRERYAALGSDLELVYYGHFAGFTR